MSRARTTWAHSLAVAHHGQITAAVVYLPQRDKLYTATLGGGAHLNGQPITSSTRTALDGAHFLAPKIQPGSRALARGRPRRPAPFPPLAGLPAGLVAEGRFDAMLTLRDAWEWDIAAGALIASEAGATTTDRTGAPPHLQLPRAPKPPASSPQAPPSTPR